MATQNKSDRYCICCEKPVHATGNNSTAFKTQDKSKIYGPRFHYYDSDDLYDTGSGYRDYLSIVICNDCLSKKAHLAMDYKYNPGGTNLKKFPFSKTIKWRITEAFKTKLEALREHIRYIHRYDDRKAKAEKELADIKISPENNFSDASFDDLPPSK